MLIPQICVTKLCCACDEGRSNAPECKRGDDLSSLMPVGSDVPGYAAIRLVVKDLSFDSACRLAPILLKGPDYNRRDCPADTTTTISTPQVSGVLTGC